MRPVAIPQSFVRHPLNALLGTDANVRLLRLLADQTAGSIGAPEAAEHTGLTQAGARRALKRLTRSGFVEQFGGGRGQRFRLRESDPLSDELRRLFRAERARYDDLLRRLRGLLEGFPEIQRAWIEEAPVEPGHPMHIGVLADARALGYLREEVQSRVVDLEGELDLTIEVHAYSGGDVPDVHWDGTVVLAGHPPASARDARPVARSHDARMARAKRLSIAIAEMLDRDPSLRRRALRHLDRLLEGDQGPASHDLEEWRRILGRYSTERLKDFLVAETPRAERLRQSSPFFAVLTSDQRSEAFESAGGGA